jgi:Flp pilus assembly protein TadB
MEHYLLGGIALIGAILAFLGWRTRKEEAKSARLIREALNKRTTDTIRDTIQDTLNANVHAIESDLTSNDPATALAERGNARSRES